MYITRRQLKRLIETVMTENEEKTFDAPNRKEEFDSQPTKSIGSISEKTAFKMQLGMMSGDSYYLYSEQPFQLGDNKESSEGSCGVGYLHHKPDSRSCHKMKFRASSSEHYFRLTPTISEQKFYIIGI